MVIDYNQKNIKLGRSMTRIARALCMVIFALTLLYTLTSSVKCQFVVLPKIYITPRINNASTGTYFTINLNVTNAHEVYAWDVYISWNPPLLEVNKFIEGSFLNPYGNYSTYFYYRKNEAEGWLYMYCGLQGEPFYHAASGNGTLASVKFLVQGVGECALDLYNSYLRHYGPYDMAHNREGGYFNNKLGAQIYEIDYNGDTIIDFYGSSISNSTVDVVNFNPTDKSINFTVTGPDGTNGYCNISISRKMLDCPTNITDWKIFLGDIDVTSSCILTRDVYYTYIYIPYSHSIQTITLRGTWDLVVGGTIKHHIIWDIYEFDIFTTSNSTVGAVYFNQPMKSINFTVTGITDTTGFSNVTMPRNILDCLDDIEQWQILLGSTDISSSCTKTRNDTHTFIYIPYTHSTQTITVRGKWVIPEIPETTMATLLIMVISGLAVIVALKKKVS